jgi:hypothetical protein
MFATHVASSHTKASPTERYTCGSLGRFFDDSALLCGCIFSPLSAEAMASRSTFARLSLLVHPHRFAPFVLHRSPISALIGPAPPRIKRRPMSSRLRSRLFPPSESQFLPFVRLICKKDSSCGQEALRDERSVRARRCKPRERQLGLPRSLAGRKKSHRWPGYGMLYRQACDKKSRTSFINCEYESIKFHIGRGRRGRMKARG